MKKFSMGKAAAGILCLGLVMQSASFLPANAENTSKVTVNEVCSKYSTYKAADGNLYDWIELYNSDSQEADISGWGFSDKEAEPYRYTFPDGTKVPAKGRLIVFCDSDAGANDTKIVPFGLSSTGETLTLTDKQGNTAQTLTFGALAKDTSYGQYPDGSGEFYELSCTPEKENAAPEGSAAVHQPAFSKDSGFYDSSFALTLTADEGCTIYYTMDGSDPTIESKKYEAPITVKDMSDTENRLSARTDIAPNGVEKPRENVDKAAVIRAVSVDSEGRISAPVTKTYFIGTTNSGYYPKMKVVSLVTDPDNLFDYEKGIYCLGKAFETENTGGGRNVQPWNLIANYSMRGREWERPASFTLFENGEKVLEENVGIRIKGNYSRSLAQKSFNIYTRKDYGVPEFEYDFFGGKATKAKNGKSIKKYEGVVLRNGGNDNGTAFFRDSINQSLITDRNFAYQATTECVVFLDGEYWGIYQLMEKIDKCYINEHYGIKKSDVAIVKNGELDEGTEQDLQDWLQLQNGVINGTVSYEQFCQKVDIQSYMDYMAAQIYWCNADWPQRNISMWRSDAIDEENPYADGKWRPILYDTESGQGLYGSYDKSANADCYRRLKELHEDGEFAQMFIKLLENDDFRLQYSRTFMDIANNNFTTDKTKSVAESYLNNYKQQITDSFARFNSRSSGGERQLESAYQTIINFYAQRFQYAESTTRQAAKLSSNPYSLTVNNNASMGSIKLNTLDLGAVSKWSGKYHGDYTIDLSISPSEGAKFTRWSVSGAKIVEGDETSTSIKIQLQSNAVVRPVYENEVIIGDVNADGDFNVADIVMLQKWLSADRNTELANWKAGDLCEDGVIDVFDLVAMRRELLLAMRDTDTQQTTEQPQNNDQPKDQDQPKEPNQPQQPERPQGGERPRR